MYVCHFLDVECQVIVSLHRELRAAVTLKMYFTIIGTLDVFFIHVFSHPCTLSFSLMLRMY